MSFFRRFMSFLWRSVVYRIVVNLFEWLPNTHYFNLIRGAFVGLFLKKKGKRFAVASGCTLIMIQEMSVGDDVYIAHDCWFNAAGGLTISDGVIVSPKTVIATTKHRYEKGKVVLRGGDKAPVSIGAGTWIASNVTVTKGVTVGKGTIVGAGSVISKDLPDFYFCAGQPARPIRRLFDGDR